jgi:hypothetical protein
VATAADPVKAALEQFANDAHTKFAALARGAPEDQLRGLIERLLGGVGSELGRGVVAKGESLLAGGQGKPDYAVVVDGTLTGYLELKAPGTGVVPSRFKGHDREQSTNGSRAQSEWPFSNRATACPQTFGELLRNHGSGLLFSRGVGRAAALV